MADTGYCVWTHHDGTDGGYWTSVDHCEPGHSCADPETYPGIQVSMVDGQKIVRVPDDVFKQMTSMLDDPTDPNQPTTFTLPCD